MNMITSCSLFIMYITGSKEIVYTFEIIFCMPERGGERKRPGIDREAERRAEEEINPFQHKPWFLRICSVSLLKPLWGKQKLLTKSNFSSSHSVFYLFGELSAIFVKFDIVVCKHFLFGRVSNLSFGKGLTHTTQCSFLTHKRYIAVENIVRKGEIACNKVISFFFTMFFTLYGTYFLF